MTGPCWRGRWHDPSGYSVGRFGHAAVADVALAVPEAASGADRRAQPVAGDRAAGSPSDAAPSPRLLIVANEEHRFIIAEQLREIGVTPEALILEPVGRNTAPAACVAALRLVAAQPRTDYRRPGAADAGHAVGPRDRRSRRVPAGDRARRRRRPRRPSRDVRHHAGAGRDRLRLYRERPRRSMAVARAPSR